MVKQHLKRLASPRTWPIPKKTLPFVKRPYPGPHKLQYQICISVFLRDLVGVVKTVKEAKYVIHKNLCLIDGKPANDDKQPVGLFDTVSLPSLNKFYRVVINAKNKLVAVEISKEEANFKISKLVKKTSIKGNKTQLNTLDGRCILVDDQSVFSVGDSLQLEVPTQKILSVLKLELDSVILLQSGRHVGKIGVIEAINESDIVVKTDNNDAFQTKKEYAIVIGKQKPIITI
jgi:small subunit ribosomal protein S4e